MTITEKKLLDGFTGLSNGLHNMSVVDGLTIWWVYRRGDSGDGYNPMVSDRDEAEEITLENNRWATIELDVECENHPALQHMRELYEQICG